MRYIYKGERDTISNFELAPGKPYEITKIYLNIDKKQMIAIIDCELPGAKGGLRKYYEQDFNKLWETE